MNERRVPQVLQPLVHVHDYSTAPPSGEGCPRCDDYPDFPAKHCGRPGCRDEQIIAYARANGLDPAAALEDATRQAQAPPPEPEGDSTPEKPGAPAAGLCSSCVLVDACVVGAAVTRTAGSLAAVVSRCEGHKPAKAGS